MSKKFLGWLTPAFLGLIPVAVALVNAIRGGAILVGDRAVFALQVKDAATGSFPSVGQYSWHGWNHPGSLLFYLFAPFHWISGGAAWGLFVGVAIYSATLLVVIAWLGDRLRGVWGGAVGVGALLACWVSVGRIASVDAWTPYLALPLFIIFLLAAWGVTERDRASMWALFVTGSLLVQVHVGYLPLVAVVGLAACVVFWWTGGNQRSITRPLAVALLLFVPFLFHPRLAARNLADLAQYFWSTNEPSIGLSRAVQVMAFETSPQASWLAGPSEVGLIGEAPSASVGWFVGLVVLVAAATVWSWRSPEQSPRRKFLNAAPLVWGSLATAVVSVAQVRGYLFPYVVLWRSAIVILALCWIVGVALANTTMIRQPMVTVAAIGVFFLNLVGAMLPAFSETTSTSDADNVREAIDQALVAADLISTDGAILLELGDGGLVGLYPALVYEFEERGIRSGIEEGTEWVFGDRILRDKATDVWLVCDTGYAFSLLASAPGATVVSNITPFDSQEESRVRVLQTELASQLRASGRSEFLSSLDSPLVALALQDLEVDHLLAEELATLNSRTPEPGFRFGIVAFAPDAVPEIWWTLEAFS